LNWRRGHSGRSTPFLFCPELDTTLLNLTFLILSLNCLVDHGRHLAAQERADGLRLEAPRLVTLTKSIVVA
jgi:hypothetical protein